MRKLVLAFAIGLGSFFIQAQESNISHFVAKDNPPAHEYNYDYYAKKYNNARIERGIGIALTSVGLGAIIIPSFAAAFSGTHAIPALRNIAIFGIVTFNVGFPLWISGTVKKRNNKKAMEKTKNLSLAWQSTPHGVGLVFNF